MEDKIFAIIKISYDSNNQAIGGVCGTCFFINENNFITAKHCFNETIFSPNGGYLFCKVFLLNTKGKIIENPQIKKLDDNCDLSIGYINGKNEYFSSNDILFENYKAGDEVFNIGFPEDNQLISNFIIKSIKQSGKINEIKNETYNNLNDEIKIINKKMIIPNYTSKKGFSGGPLFHLISNKIIGYMSLVPSNSQDQLQRVRSIALSEIMHLL